MENSKPTYWQNAERTNGRMAMMGLFAQLIGKMPRELMEEWQ